MKNKDEKFNKFEEECRRYLYEKEALKELERRFVRFNTNGDHYVNTQSHTDPLKRYRLLENHVNYVDEVFRKLEKMYGPRIAKIIRQKMIRIYSMEEKEEIHPTYRNCIDVVLNKNSRGVYQA